MMRVQNEVAAIVETDPAILLRKYEKQIKELKHELIMHDALVERTGVVYDEHTPEQKHQLMKVVRQFVDAPTREKEDEALHLNSVHEIRELFRQFKLLLKNAESDALGRSTASIRAGSAGSNASRSQSSTGSRSDIHNLNSSNELGTALSDVFVGDEDPGAAGFGLGIVSGGARPSTMDTVKKSNNAKVVGGGRGSGSPSASGGDGSGSRGGGRSRHRSPSPTRPVLDASVEERGGGRGGDSPTTTHTGEDIGDDENSREAYAMRLKSEAFGYYKSGPGKKVQKSLHEEKDKLVDAKHKVKHVSTRLNAVKLQIDKVKSQLEDKRSARGGGGSSPTHPSRKAGAGSGGVTPARPQQDEVVDEEEFMLMTAEREAKRDYRSLFDDLKEAKSELEFTNRSVELLRMRLVREFEEWYEEEGHASALSKDDGSSRGRGYDTSGGGGGGFGSYSFAGAFSKDDKLDDGEKFDQMEVDRIRAQDPDSLAFFQAQKKMRQQAGGTSVKQARKPKRA